MHMHIMIHAIVMSVQPYLNISERDDSTSVALVMNSRYIVPYVFAVCGVPFVDTYNSTLPSMYPVWKPNLSFVYF